MVTMSGCVCVCDWLGRCVVVCDWLGHCVVVCNWLGRVVVCDWLGCVVVCDWLGRCGCVWLAGSLCVCVCVWLAGSLWLCVIGWVVVVVCVGQLQSRHKLQLPGVWNKDHWRRQYTTNSLAAVNIVLITLVVSVHSVISSTLQMAASVFVIILWMIWCSQIVFFQRTWHISYLLSTHANRQGMDISVIVCLFVFVCLYGYGFLCWG